MTAQKSTNNFMANLIYRLKSNKKTSIVILIMHLLAAPLILINGIIFLIREQSWYEKYNGITTSVAEPRFNDIYFGVGVFSTVIAGLCGIFIAINIFNYLYKKSNVDMILSLPLTTRQRFLSDFTAGLISYLAPFLVSTVFTTILSFICQGALENSHYYHDFYKETFLSIPEFAFKATLFGFFIMLMAYVVTVLALTFCGSFFEALSSTFYINALIPLGIFLSGQVFMKNLYGIDVSVNIMPLIYRTSPFGGLFFVGNYFSQRNNFV